MKLIKLLFHEKLAIKVPVLDGHTTTRKNYMTIEQIILS